MLFEDKWNANNMKGDLCVNNIVLGYDIVIIPRDTRDIHECGIKAGVLMHFSLCIEPLC